VIIIGATKCAGVAEVQNIHKTVKLHR
jgi:hypothetical protein